MTIKRFLIAIGFVAIAIAIYVFVHFQYGFLVSAKKRKTFHIAEYLQETLGSKKFPVIENKIFNEVPEHVWAGAITIYVEDNASFVNTDLERALNNACTSNTAASNAYIKSLCREKKPFPSIIIKKSSGELMNSLRRGKMSNTCISCKHNHRLGYNFPAIRNKMQAITPVSRIAARC